MSDHVRILITKSSYPNDNYLTNDKWPLLCLCTLECTVQLPISVQCCDQGNAYFTFRTLVLVEHTKEGFSYSFVDIKLHLFVIL